MRLILISCVLLALAACQKPQQGPANETAPAAEAGPVKGVDRSHKGRPFPDVKFLQDDEDGAGEMGGDSLLGEPALINFWASWCAPCIKELPTLKALNDSRKFAGAIIPLNQDSGTQASVSAFMAKHRVDGLGNYQDPKMAFGGALGVEVLPTTILFDADGKEVWRYVGDLDWTSPDAAKLLAEAGGPQRG
jgi:thiol-disulfide isomerase/thioredoxin